jgi:hypothetical protein
LGGRYTRFAWSGWYTTSAVELIADSDAPLCGRKRRRRALIRRCYGDSADITTFANLWTSAKSNGWKVSSAALPTFNFTYAAAHAPGQYYRPAFSDPLFDS